MILVAVDEVAGSGADLDEIRAVPGPSECHGRLVEEHVDVGGDVRLAGTALLRLVDEPDDRGVLRRQVFLRSGERRPGDGERAEQAERDEGRAESEGHRHDANVFDGWTRSPP